VAAPSHAVPDRAAPEGSDPLMSQENVDVVRRIYEAFARDDLPLC
jgi:hypothetical protein